MSMDKLIQIGEAYQKAQRANTRFNKARERVDTVTHQLALLHDYAFGVSFVRLNGGKIEAVKPQWGSTQHGQEPTYQTIHRYPSYDELACAIGELHEAGIELRTAQSDLYEVSRD